mgnify:CR=1 FL=1
MLTELFPVLHPTGTTPDDLAGWPGNAAIVTATFRANQKAAQYTLRVVPGGLSLMGVLVDIASPAFLSMCQKEIVKADNIANVLLIGKQIAENWLCPAIPAFRGWNLTLEQKISNPVQTHVGELLLINHSYDICFFLLDGHMAIWREIISVWDTHV